MSVLWISGPSPMSGKCRAEPSCPRAAAVAGTLTAAASAGASEMWAQKQEQAPPKPENVMTPDAALTL